MKLIIDIPKKTFEDLRQGVFITVGETFAKRLIKYIKNGIPLDKIKKQIDEQSAMHMDGELYIRNFDVKWILEGNEVRE